MVASLEGPLHGIQVIDPAGVLTAPMYRAANREGAWFAGVPLDARVAMPGFEASNAFALGLEGRRSGNSHSAVFPGAASQARTMCGMFGDPAHAGRPDGAPSEGRGAQRNALTAEPHALTRESRRNDLPAKLHAIGMHAAIIDGVPQANARPMRGPNRHRDAILADPIWGAL